MPLTSEQEIAQRALQKAVEDHAAAFRSDGSDAEVLTDWVVVSCLVSYDDQGQRAGYMVGYSNGEMPEHIACGLFRVGESIASGVYVRDSRED